MKTKTDAWGLSLKAVGVGIVAMACWAGAALTTHGAEPILLAQAGGAAAEIGQEMRATGRQLRQANEEAGKPRPVFSVEEKAQEEAAVVLEAAQEEAAKAEAAAAEATEPAAGAEAPPAEPEESAKPEEGAKPETSPEGETPKPAAETGEKETAPAAEEAAPEGETPAAKPEAEEGAEAPARRSRAGRERPGAATFDIKELRIQGDRELLDDLGLTASIEADTVGQKLGERDIQAIARRYNRELVQRGYYLARIWTPPTDYREGVLVFAVDKGRVGRLAFYEKGPEEKTPYEGHFTARQLERRMGEIREGEAFDYNEFYKGVFRMNSHPDLTVDTDLKVRRERVDEDLLRYVDMDFYVEDRLPIHGVFEIRNSGTEATDEWRMGLTLQHLNLTKRDDVLTVTLPFSLDLNTLQSIAGSYYLPHYIGKGGAFTLYGGYSQLTTEDLVPDIDLEGTGWFAGLQGTYDLVNSDRHQLSASLGMSHQVIEDTLVLQGEGGALPREVTLNPFALVFSYSSVQPDRLEGRNFLTSQTTANFGGLLGASEDEEIQQQRETAEANYYVERLQLARIQPVFGKEEGNKWLIFTKLDGQYSSGPLIPSEQKAVGGLDNVRGYTEREVFGDYGVSGTLELRSPIWSGSHLSRFGGKETEGTERLQLVFFLDGAEMFLDEAPQNVEDNTTLLSAGAGVRFALTQYTQFKLDWGFPLEETFLSDSGGRGHVSAEVQF